MAREVWIRAADGDWYRTSEVVAVKTTPHAAGGFTVTVETRRHDNIDVTGHLEHPDQACRCRDDLAKVLATAGDGSVIAYHSDGFSVESLTTND
jgi:hypothetical protein